MDSLIKIDFKSLSNLGIALLNKIEKGTGWIFSTETAKKEGYKNLIDEISKREDINPIDRAVIISQFNKIKREHRNKAQIIDKSIKLLEKGDNPERISDDWLIKFFESCKNVSDEELQYIWAKILANECKEEKNNSFKLLRTISELSKNEIDAIIKIVKECNYGVSSFEAIGILCLSNNYLENINVKYEEIVELEDIGIMKRETISLEDEFAFKVNENKIIKFIKKEEKKGKILKLVNFAEFYRFTSIGMELLELINVKNDKTQFQKLENALKDDYNMIILNN